MSTTWTPTSTWQKSIRSGSNEGECVELAAGRAALGARDTKDARHTLVFSSSALAHAINAVKE